MISEPEQAEAYPATLLARTTGSTSKEGLLKRQQQGRQWYVVATDAGGDSKTNESDAVADLGHAPNEEEPIPDPEDDDLAL